MTDKNVLVRRTSYSSTGIEDVSREEISQYRYPLVIVAREGQAVRLRRFRREIDLVVLGWWELPESRYFGERSKRPIKEAFLRHDVVVFMDPERVLESVQEDYRKLISAVGGFFREDDFANAMLRSEEGTL